MAVMRHLTVDGTTYDTVGEASVTQVQTSGTKIATVSIDGTATDLYAPEGGGSTVTVTQTLTSGTEIASVSVDGTATKLYAPEGGGGGGINKITLYKGGYTAYVDAGLTTSFLDYYDGDLSAARTALEEADVIELFYGVTSDSFNKCFVVYISWDTIDETYELMYFDGSTNYNFISLY